MSHSSARFLTKILIFLTVLLREIEPATFKPHFYRTQTTVDGMDHSLILPALRSFVSRNLLRNFLVQLFFISITVKPGTYRLFHQNKCWIFFPKKIVFSSILTFLPLLLKCMISWWVLVLFVSIVFECCFCSKMSSNNNFFSSLSTFLRYPIF